MMMNDIARVMLHETKFDGKTILTGAYGPELLLDCRQCDPSTFNRKSIEGYMKALCKAIDMKPETLHFWDDEGVPDDEKETEPHLVGVSAIQFILTSSVVIHTLTLLERVYVDIFSCKAFDDGEARRITRDWFKVGIMGNHLIQRF